MITRPTLYIPALLVLLTVGTACTRPKSHQRLEHGTMVKIPPYGKSAMLQRPATNEEIKKTGRALANGEEAWVYSTLLEIMADESGVCFIQSGLVVFSKPIFGVS
jgi:hypothetical protein